MYIHVKKLDQKGKHVPVHCFETYSAMLYLGVNLNTAVEMDFLRWCQRLFSFPINTGADRTKSTI